MLNSFIDLLLLKWPLIIILFNIGATYSNLKQYKKAIKFYSKIALVTNDKNKVDEANDSINKIRLIAN